MLVNLVLNSGQVSPKEICLDINELLIFKLYATGNRETCIIFSMFRSLPFDTNTQIKEAEWDKRISMMVMVSSLYEKFILCLTPYLQVSFQLFDVDGHENEHPQLKHVNHSVLLAKAEPSSEGSCHWLKCHPIKEEKSLEFPFFYCSRLNAFHDTKFSLQPRLQLGWTLVLKNPTLYCLSRRPESFFKTVFW